MIIILRQLLLKLQYRVVLDLLVKFIHPSGCMLVAECSDGTIPGLSVVVKVYCNRIHHPIRFHNVESLVLHSSYESSFAYSSATRAH